MKKRVYLETTIVSYLTARPSRDLIQVARQELTREWWEERRDDFDLYISQFVVDEAGSGDAVAAEKRLRILDNLQQLAVTDEAIALGEMLIREGALPEKAATDGLHRALATVHEMDVLLTWNCRHLANAEILGVVNRLIRSRGFESPIICTPDELMGE